MSRARLALAALILAVNVGAGSASEVTADLEGQPIPRTSVGDHYCHDFDWPRIHCYGSEAGLEDAVAPYVGAHEAAVTGWRAAPLGSDGSQAAARLVGYVKVFQLATFAGSIAYLSRSYPNLGEIGWSDRISSYIVYGGASGELYTDLNYSGAIDYFCCGQSVASLSSTFDDKFSSLNLA